MSSRSHFFFLVYSFSLCSSCLLLRRWFVLFCLCRIVSCRVNDNWVKFWGEQKRKLKNERTAVGYDKVWAGEKKLCPECSKE